MVLSNLLFAPLFPLKKYPGYYLDDSNFLFFLPQSCINDSYKILESFVSKCTYCFQYLIRKRVIDDGRQRFARPLLFFGQCVIHLIGEGKHESQDTIWEEMQQSNLVSYIIHKYNTRFPDTVYDLDSLNFSFENMTPYATSQKSGVFKSSNGLLCILSVILAESEYHVHEWKKVF